MKKIRIFTVVVEIRNVIIISSAVGTRTRDDRKQTTQLSLYFKQMDVYRLEYEIIYALTIIYLLVFKIKNNLEFKMI